MFRLSYTYMKVLRFYMRRWSKLDYSWECSRERQFLHELMDVIAKVNVQKIGARRIRPLKGISLFLQVLLLSRRPFIVCCHSSSLAFSFLVLFCFYLFLFPDFSLLKGGLGRLRGPLLQLRQRHGLGGVASEALEASEGKWGNV